jgi:hypothetical protein
MRERRLRRVAHPKRRAGAATSAELGVTPTSTPLDRPSTTPEYFRSPLAAGRRSSARPCPNTNAPQLAAMIQWQRTGANGPGQARPGLSQRTPDAHSQVASGATHQLPNKSRYSGRSFAPLHHASTANARPRALCGTRASALRRPHRGRERSARKMSRERS